MEKEFFDVFPNLKLKQELSELLEEVIVTKVACNSAKTCVRVYLKATAGSIKSIFSAWKSRFRDSAFLVLK